MAITVSAKDSHSQLPPSGTFIARCFSVIDLGSHQSEFNGAARIARKVRIGFELPEELMDNGKPFAISKEFGLSLHAKANLRKRLESWRGRPFTAEELNGFNLSALLGATALVNITHENRRDGSGKFAHIAAITKPMRGQQCPPPINPPVEYSVDQGQNGIFANLPEWMREKISKCAEWKLDAPVEPSATTGNSNAPAPDTDEDDNTPF
jgi:hypothetical protein